MVRIAFAITRGRNLVRPDEEFDINGAIDVILSNPTHKAAEHLIPMSFDDPMFSAMTEYPAYIQLAIGKDLSRMSIVNQVGESSITLLGGNESCRHGPPQNPGRSIQDSIC